MNEEHKRKISLANKGKKRSNEFKILISKLKKGKPSPRKGVKLTEETKRKIGLANKGNKYNLGKHHSIEAKQKMSISRKGKRTLDKHPLWQENPTYNAVHQWLSKYKGKSKDSKCIDCGRTAQNWSNKDHKYKRNLEDYEPRCIKCHRQYDVKKFGFNLLRDDKGRFIKN